VSRLDRTAWPEVAASARAGHVLLIPVGSTEQHGPHLPVTTDTDIAESVAAGAAGREDRLVVAPALAYGSSGEHEGFAGTLSIGRAATELVLLELGRSASRDFAYSIAVSTHGGNRVPIGRALVRLRQEGHPFGCWSPRWAGDLHAGRTETSLMLAIAPERVRLDRAEAGDLRPAPSVLPELRARGVRAVSANGVLGDPAGANAEEGRALLCQAVDDLLAEVRARCPDPAGGVR
jgi:mycofactocin precursor peptide peptidase